MRPVAETSAVRVVAARCHVPAELTARLDALGLLPLDRDGSASLVAVQRLELVGFAHSRGIDHDLLVHALQEYGDLLQGFHDFASPPSEHADLAQAGAAVGLPPEIIAAIATATDMGNGQPLTRDDVEALRSARHALELGLPLDVLLQLLRVYADNLERLAESETRIFHDNIHEGFRAAGLTGRELMEATGALGAGLRDLVEPTVLYFHRKAWTRAQQHDFLQHLTEDSRALPSAPGAWPCAVVFADLSGFTPLTAAMGDAAAAQVLARFAGGVRRLAAERDGRVVKQIGDAFMLVFSERLDAVRWGVGLLRWCGDEHDFPPVHLGAAAGEVLFRDGDFVGSVVNTAARVASVSEPMQFLVTQEVLAGVALPGDVVAVPQSSLTLRGIPVPVPVSSVSAARR